MTDLYSTRLDEAIALAAEAFRPISRKQSPAPYLSHLLAVTSLVGEAGGDENQLIAAVLHDLIEDIPGWSGERLERRFGADVAELVLALSDSVTRPRPPWKERKEGYIRKLAGADARVKLVCAADKLHNATTLARDFRLQGEVTFERFNGKAVGTRWYYRAVIDALSDGWSHSWLLSELDVVVSAFGA